MSRPDSIIYFMTMMPRAEYLSEERMGTTLAEAQKINLSLLELGNVISALSEAATAMGDSSAGG